MRRYFQCLKQGFILGLLLIGVALLSGCGDLNSQFICPMQPGVTCESLDQVNTKVDQGQWVQTQPLPTQSKQLSDSMFVLPVSNSLGPVIRSPEPVMRVWIAPYQDTQGNFFSSTVVYHVMKPGHWSMEQAIKDESHV